MSSLNKVIAIGRLGKDPVVNYTSGGKAVANFDIAADESYKNSAGERVKKTEWLRCVAWGPSVDNFIKPYLHQGDLVYVEGKLQTRKWEDKKNGGIRYTTEINITDIKSLQSRDGQQAANVSKQGTRPAANRGAAPAPTNQPARARVAAVLPAETDNDTPPFEDEDIAF